MTNLPSIKNIKPRGKFVLVRVDFNVLTKNNRVADDYRIRRTLPTIEFLKKNGAKIILISHLTEGRAKSLRPVARYLISHSAPLPAKERGAAGGARFIPDKNLDSVKNKIKKMRNGGIVLLENIRNYAGEEKNTRNFAKKLASLGDIYVNDAFSASHRQHASIVGLPKYLPSCAGLLFEEEFRNLKAAFNPPHPFLLILGGVKFGTKLGVLERFNKIADKIFIGGALANNFFKARGMDVGNSIVDNNVNVKKYLGSKKIILPIDVRKKSRAILDCGPHTVKMLNDLIKKSKFILWNGPLGDIERRNFNRGTLAIASAIAGSRARSVVGGGDTVAAIDNPGFLKKFSFVSTAGGAMLEFFSRGTLPGIEALKKQKYDP